ncbi:unnamed protein product [Peronospora farinosa]|uniref:Uncharacterized protein n=1 Tax=Peronospora farinosa TaxID=134698 RepID=A0AAV0SXG5_9STRA|nr:unnamed protein product [Peronospora farinosa]CAI5710263.1 unnamed protein product [Peronospora farinosa]
MFSAQDAVENMYEPMIYLAAQMHRSGQSSEIYSRKSTMLESITYAAARSEAARFGVEDVEFNSLMLRSSLGLVNMPPFNVRHVPGSRLHPLLDLKSQCSPIFSRSFNIFGAGMILVKTSASISLIRRTQV